MAQLCNLAIMPKRSAGILAYRYQQQQIQVLLVHPGGPFYAKKDEGAWSIPKGEYETGEDPLQVALREFEEETGNTILAADFLQLEDFRLKSGKIVSAWAVPAEFEKPYLRSNTFELEWPPGSGKVKSYPEADRADWFTIEEARLKIHPGQLSLIDQLGSALS